ncbi:MAG: response regulator [Gammaproteobacteria bacterium]|jgi:two-component system LytT family response regulator|nr:response regulator [Gammaproteobacteria bacterium]MBT5680926.1 response regulator [Gammaproteobacteria bacterium]MBT6559026.1 response regulator [Gammaproteobacteria bacterium]
MGALTAILVDDEPLALKLLGSMLAQYNGIEVVAECRSSKDAVKQIQLLQPDLVFLDIHMPVLSGFDVVKKLQADVLPMVVFVTAFDQYALRAFDMHAVDYILKPIDPSRLGLAINRAMARYQLKDVGVDKSTVLSALATINDTNSDRNSDRNRDTNSDNNSDSAEKKSYEVELDGTSGQPDRLAIRDGVHTVLVRFEDIDWIDAAGDYMCVHVGAVTHVMRSTMKDLVGKLPPSMFARIHRSTMVNVKKVIGLESLPRGESLLLLSNDVTLKVSRNFRKVIAKITC